jgi:ADP-ribose pyrophosphatase YjhB (NUDIX family)
MPEYPLPIAISALIDNDRNILLLQRKKGDYVGLLGLPGGKVEKGEHVSDAAVREIFEESGIRAVFKSHLGLVSEHLVENGAVVQHFLLNVCELSPETTEISAETEGKLGWYPLGKMAEMKGRIIPSDVHIIERMIVNRGKHYFECVLEKSGAEYALKRFE